MEMELNLGMFFDVKAKMSAMMRMEGQRGIDIGVAHHVFLENIVLNRAGELLQFDALFLGGHDVERQDRQDCAVHRHGDGNAVERNGVEENLHVEDRIDGHASFADVGKGARMVGVVSTVGGQVERDGQALLASGNVAAVEGVALLGGGEPGVLTHGPGAHDIHGTIRPAQVGRDAGHAVQGLAVLDVFRRVNRLEINLLERLEGPLFGRLAGFGLEALAPLAVGHRRGSAFKRYLCKIRKFVH